MGIVDHNDVPLSSVPVPVQRAVLAAEDREFYQHAGVSLRGIARAASVVAQGGSQGASTITQQYARNAFLTQDFSVARKTEEMALAIKLERQHTKDDILGHYLNTIYYGRGAYGIAAAAHAYFDVPPERLSLAQGAVLAAVIKDPWNLDPANDAAAARRRWAWVIDAMRAAGWIDEATAAAQRYPDVRPRLAASQKLDGPTGLVVDQVERELGRHGITSQALHTTGLSVVTTLDPVAQRAALDLVGATLRGQPDKLRAALVALDPDSGGVRAYYGGDRGRGYFDDALAAHPPAATFTPIALAAGMRRGISYLSRWNGASPRRFAGRQGVPLYNPHNAQCPDCTLKTAMVRSLHTPFYALTERVGPGNVRELAVALGVAPAYDGQRSLVDAKGEPRPGKTRPDICLGRYPVTPADLASVYATFAANGVHATRHFVQSVKAADGAVLWQADNRRRRVLDSAVAADVSAVLRAVVDGAKLAPGRPAAGKPGTQRWGDTRDNQDAWMAGYTPQLAVAVWMGQSVPGRIRDASGKPISGDTLPARLWRDFVSTALAGQPAVPFPRAAQVGSTTVGDADHSADTAPQGTDESDHTEESGPAGRTPRTRPTDSTATPAPDDSDDLTTPSTGPSGGVGTPSSKPSGATKPPHGG